jgi:hypothetical protein
VTAPAAPTRRIVTVRSTKLITIAGTALGLGLVAILIGALVLAGEQTASVVAAKGRARVGNPLRFDAVDADYVLTLTPDPDTADFVGSRVEQLTCAVVHPDGQKEKLHPERAAVRSTSTAGVTVARFAGRGGQTEVDCAWTGASLGGTLSVARSHDKTKTVGYVALGAGLALAAVGVVLTVIAVRGKQEIQPIG